MSISPSRVQETGCGTVGGKRSRIGILPLRTVLISAIVRIGADVPLNYVCSVKSCRLQCASKTNVTACRHPLRCDRGLRAAARPGNGSRRVLLLTIGAVDRSHKGIDGIA